MVLLIFEGYCMLFFSNVQLVIFFNSENVTALLLPLQRLWHGKKNLIKK